VPPHDAPRRLGRCERGVVMGEITKVGKLGRIWPDARKPKRKRFIAWFGRLRDRRVKHFPTRKAATLWLEQCATTTQETTP
jgi:hypothetical protein